jgi:cell division septum initiation protein DivIVA
MAYSSEEIEFARKTAKGAEKLLPALLKDFEDLKQRIEKLRQHVNDYKSMVGETPTPAPVAAPAQSASGRAKRGEPKAHFVAILKDHPDYDNDKLIEAVNQKFGVSYANSTAYRNIAEARKELKGFSLSLAS